MTGMWTKEKKKTGGFGGGNAPAGGGPPPKDMTKEMPQIGGELDKIDDALAKAEEMKREQKRKNGDCICCCF